MRVNGFRCDVCCKEYLLEPTLVIPSYYHALPAGWFLLYQGNPEQDKEPLMFCSAACLAQWAEKQATLVHDDYPKVRQELWEVSPSSTEVFQRLAERLSQLGEVPRKRLMQGNWLPGDEE